jgi:hypothetical protein
MKIALKEPSNARRLYERPEFSPGLGRLLSRRRERGLGVFESESRLEPIAFCDSFSEDRQAVDEHRKRSFGAAESYWGHF